MTVMHSSVASNTLRVGDVALQSGLPTKTVRYYDNIGLLTPTVMRSPSGYRLFSSDVLNRLAFIKQAQSLGLSLDEIRQVLQVRDRGELPCGEVRQYLEAKVTAINAQIQALEALRNELQGVLSGWDDEPSGDRLSQTICPNLQKS